jgi:ubiquinone/menaquinone biosynthesis C-methylase UbiE
MPDLDFSANVERFSGFADIYDQYRPRPPQHVLDMLIQLRRTEKPDCMVDLGCGTGLSTIVWQAYADQIIGIDPTADMLAHARQNNAAPNIDYRQGFSHATGLPDKSADIVTCSQALHWMEPDSTFAEVARILKPDGVFAAYDCDWPPTVDWQAEAAYIECHVRARQIDQAHQLSARVQSWRKEEHLQRLEASKQFRYVREMVMHAQDQGDAQRFVGLLLSQGHLRTLFKHGFSESELGIDKLRDTAARFIGDQPVNWYWSYRIRLAVK